MNLTNAERGADVLAADHPDAAAGLIPRCRTLDGFATECGSLEGIALHSLPAGTAMTVCTRNSRYRFVVLDPAERRVIMSGSSTVPEPREGRLEGTTAGGSALRLGWIGIGFRLELSVDDRRITTSPVSSVTIDSVPPRVQ